MIWKISLWNGDAIYCHACQQQQQQQIIYNNNYNYYYNYAYPIITYPVFQASQTIDTNNSYTQLIPNINRPKQIIPIIDPKTNKEINLHDTQNTNTDTTIIIKAVTAAANSEIPPLTPNNTNDLKESKGKIYIDLFQYYKFESELVRNFQNKKINLCFFYFL